MRFGILALCCALGLLAAGTSAAAASAAASNPDRSVTPASAAHDVAEGAECGRPASAGTEPSASDALYVLLAGVGIETCPSCICDVDDSSAVTATDATDAITDLLAADPHDLLVLETEGGEAGELRAHGEPAQRAGGGT